MVLSQVNRLCAVPYISFHRKGSQRLSSCAAVVTWNANILNRVFFRKFPSKAEPAHNATLTTSSFRNKCYFFEEWICYWVENVSSNRTVWSEGSVNCVWSIHFPWIIFHWSEKRVQLWTKGKKSACLRAENNVGIIWFFSLSGVPSLMVIFLVSVLVCSVFLFLFVLIIFFLSMRIFLRYAVIPRRLSLPLQSANLVFKSCPFCSRCWSSGEVQAWRGGYVRVGDHKY